MTTLPGEGSLLRIFIGESDRHAGMLLYEWIVRTARGTWLGGSHSAARRRGVWRAQSSAHGENLGALDRFTDHVEIVDRAEKIEAFLPVIDGAIADGLATVEKVQIKFYRSGPA